MTKFDVYLEELIKWNKKFNLTSITDPDQVKIRHFEDSLSVLEAIDLSGQKVVDVGAGAGFPGIPLKIKRPNISLVLVEATKKKVDFLKHIIKLLGLKNTKAVWARAEDLAKQDECFGAFDVVLARAVAKFPKLLEYTIPFLKPGGVLVAQKQQDIEQELETSKACIKKFKCRIKNIKKVSVGGILRSLVVVERIV